VAEDQGENTDGIFDECCLDIRDIADPMKTRTIVDSDFI
jgi:hypothetical protein